MSWWRFWERPAPPMLETYAVIFADRTGLILSTNAAAEALTGWPSAELRNTSIRRIMPSRFHAAHEAAIARLRVGGKSRLVGRAVRVAVLTRDGHEIPVELAINEFTHAGVTIYVGVLCRVA